MAADAVGAGSLANAVIVELLRVLLLIPFLLIVGQWRLLRGHSVVVVEGRGSLVIAWFAFGFRAMVLFNS